jgi:RNA polymerase sigma-70 factor (ECF subfamily)
MVTTPVSLLEQLRRHPEEAAWKRFVHLYTPLLYHWARKLGLQPDDATDLVQDVFALLVRKLPDFNYDPARRFRGWLWTLTVNKWRENHRRLAGVPAAEAGEALVGVSGPDPTAAFDEAEYWQFLVRRALELMQAEFQPRTWQACWEYVVAGRPAADVARQLGLTVNAVHLAKSRVLRRLRQELEGLLD